MHVRRLPFLLIVAMALVTTAVGVSLGRSALGATGPASTTPAAASAGFVQRCGIHFCLDGHVFYFAGANDYDMFTYGGSYGDTETQYMDKTRIDNHMAELQADRVTVLRLWMFDHESWHGFETAKGVYNDQEFAEFDYIIQSAKAHNIRLIPTLENYWEAYGGIDTRLSWEGLSGGQPGRAAFFDKSRCPGCFTQYKNYVNYALNRVNHYSGVKYRDDPTIFAWELMNEPRYQDQSAAENVNGTTLRAWVDEMGAYVKSVDPNHLVDAGLEGHGTKYGFGGDEGNPFVYIQESPYVDFTSAHPYPNEGWANLTLAQTLTLINSWISDSHNVVGKPFFMGEFNTQGVDRTTWWTAIYNDLETNDADGSAFWWYPDSQAGGDNYSVKSGAPELAAFRTHSDHMSAKSGGAPPTPSASASPSRSPSPSASPTPTRSPSPSASPTTSPTRSPSPSPTSTTASGCAVTYQVSDWGSGFTANVTVANNGGTAINGWTVAWSFAGNQTVNNTWNASLTQSGKQVSAVNLSYNATIPAHGTVSFGFQAAYSGTNAVPAAFTLNGTACTTA